jgi:putative ABC transport system permease protein
MRELAALGPDMLEVTAARDGDQPVVLPQESVGMVARIGPVTKVSAVANTHTEVRRSDRADPTSSIGTTVLATRLDLLQVINGRVQDGHWLTPVTATFPTAVLGSVAAARLGVTTVPGAGSEPLVMIKDRWFSVIGILAPTPLSPDIDRSVLVGWEAARTELDFNGHPTVIYVRSRESAVEGVRAVLPPTVHPEQPFNVVVTRPSEVLAAKRATQSTFSALFLGLAGVALLVGGIGVANTMVISVLERRTEIGLRRALGASRGQIRGQFLTESVALSTLGGTVGTALGVLATAGYALHQGWPVVVPLTSSLAGLGGAVVVGMIAGGYPSVRAARLTPTEALATV